MKFNKIIKTKNSVKYFFHNVGRGLKKTYWSAAYKLSNIKNNIEKEKVSANENKERDIDINYIDQFIETIFNNGKYNLTSADKTQLVALINTLFSYDNLSKDDITNLRMKPVNTYRDFSDLCYSISDIISSLNEKQKEQIIIDFILHDIDYVDINYILTMFITNDNKKISTEKLRELLEYIDSNSIKIRDINLIKKCVISNGFISNDDEINNLINALSKLFSENQKQNINVKNQKQKTVENKVDFNTVDILDYLSEYLESDKINQAERTMIFNKVQKLLKNSLEPIFREKLQKISNLSPEFRFKTLIEILDQIELDYENVCKNVKKNYYKQIEFEYNKMLKKYKNVIATIPEINDFKAKFDRLIDKTTYEDAYETIIEELKSFEEQCRCSYTDDEYNEIESLKSNIKDIYAKINGKEEAINLNLDEMLKEYNNLDGNERYRKSKERLESYLSDLKLELNNIENLKQKELRVSEYKEKLIEEYNKLANKYSDYSIFSEEKYVAAFEKFCESMDVKMAYDAITNEFDKIDNMIASCIEIENITRTIADNLVTISDEKHTNEIEQKLSEIVQKYNDIDLSISNAIKIEEVKIKMRDLENEVNDYMKSIDNKQLSEQNVSKNFHILTPSELVDLYKKDNSEEENIEKTINTEILYNKRNEYARKVIELSNMIDEEKLTNEILLKDIKLTSSTLEEGLNYCKDEYLIEKFNQSTSLLRNLFEEKSIFETKLKQVESLIFKKEQEIKKQETIKQIEQEKEKEEENRIREIEYEKAYLEAEELKKEAIKIKKEEIQKEIDKIRERKIQKEKLEKLKERRRKQLAKQEQKAARLAKKEENTKEVPNLETYITDYVQTRTNDLIKEAVMTYNDQFMKKHI